MNWLEIVKRDGTVERHARRSHCGHYTIARMSPDGTVNYMASYSQDGGWTGAGVQILGFFPTLDEARNRCQWHEKELQQ